MTDTTCKWVASDQPRVLPGRHLDGCDTETCNGCQPCSESHCRICARQHTDTGATCPDCLDAVRTSLIEILRMCRALPEEVEVKGVNSEAMVLLGPVTNPEAWGHREASARAGRIDAGYLKQATEETHPLLVLATWEDVYREAFDAETTSAAAVVSAAAYLGAILSLAARYEWVPFEDFARDLRGCVRHMERVLHDGEQVIRTRVPCLDDGTRLELRHGQQAVDDRHVCPKCRRRYDETEYRLAKAEHLRSQDAETFVLIADACHTANVSQHTVRTWIRRDKVRSERDLSGRLTVWWPDVHRVNLERMSRVAVRKAG